MHTCIQGSALVIPVLQNGVVWFTRLFLCVNHVRDVNFLAKFHSPRSVELDKVNRSRPNAFLKSCGVQF